MSIATLPDGRQICDTPGHQHQLRADAFACAFNQTWKRLEEESRAEQAAAPEGVEVTSMEAESILIGDEVRLRPVTHPEGGLYVEVVNKITTPNGLIRLELADGGDLHLTPSTVRWVRYVDAA